MHIYKQTRIPPYAYHYQCTVNNDTITISLRCTNLCSELTCPPPNLIFSLIPGVDKPSSDACGSAWLLLCFLFFLCFFVGIPLLILAVKIKVNNGTNSIEFQVIICCLCSTLLIYLFNSLLQYYCWDIYVKKFMCTLEKFRKIFSMTIIY